MGIACTTSKWVVASGELMGIVSVSGVIGTSSWVCRLEQSFSISIEWRWFVADRDVGVPGEGGEVNSEGYVFLLLLT